MSSHNLDINVICELIIDGLSFRKMAEHLNVPLSTLHDFTALSEHYARVRLALETSAQTYDEKAEEALLNAKSSMTEIQRARELAQHYRWKAAKRNPIKYSEKIQQEIKADVKVEQTTITIFDSKEEKK